MIELLPPRSFRDFTVPCRDDGTAIIRCYDDEDYKAYVRWLANYLVTADSPLTEVQNVWLREQGRSPESVIFECADTFGYSLWDLSEINRDFEDGVTWGTYVARMRKFWQEEKLAEDYSFEEWFGGMNEAVYERLQREWEEERTAPEWSHADIPFRPLLSWALRQIAAPEERFRQIDRYFRIFDENASK